MSIYNGLVAETKQLLARATDVRDAVTSRDDCGLREAIKNFTHAVTAAASLAPDWDNRICQALLLAAGGRRDSCPILSTRNYIHDLRDVLGIRPSPAKRVKHLEAANRYMAAMLERARVGLPVDTEMPNPLVDLDPSEAEIDAKIAKLMSREGQTWLSDSRRDPKETGKTIDDRASFISGEEARATAAKSDSVPQSQGVAVASRIVPETATLLPGGKVAVGDDVITLTDRQANVLQALVEKRSAQKSELISASGHDEAPKILKALIKAHPALANFIKMPGRRGKGGYRTTIFAAGAMPLSAPQVSTI